MRFIALLLIELLHNPNPVSIALNPNNTFAYIGSETDQVYVCAVNSRTGELSGCTLTGTGLNNPEGITFNTVGTLVYITNNEQLSVMLCDVNYNTGALTGCGTIPGAPFNGFENLAFNSSETLAYITVFPSGVFVCSVNNTTGELFGCVDSGGRGFDRPSAIMVK